MIDFTPKHWMFFACLLLSAVAAYITLRVVILDSERRDFAVFILALAGCGAAWGTWAHVKTQARIEQVEEMLAENRRAERHAHTLTAASRSKGHLTSLD